MTQQGQKPAAIPIIPESLIVREPAVKRGFYSVLQYEPFKYREERVNLAVLLEGPEVGYQGAKRLRHMEKLLVLLDPAADVRLLRGFAEEFENQFKTDEAPEKLHADALFDRTSPIGINRWLKRLKRYSRSPFRLTTPRPLTFDASLSFDSQLQTLYETMIARPRLDIGAEESKKKEYVQRIATSTLRRHINVELDPPEIKGFKYEDHSFDAAQKNGEEREAFFDFGSFDIARPTTDQVRLFLQSVDDVTDERIDNEDSHRRLTKRDFFFIYQEPSGGNPIADRALDLALHYLKKDGIKAIPLGPRVEQLGEELARKEAAD